MQLYRGIESLPALGETTVTVGSFDGVHRGHFSLLTTLRQRAKAEGRQSVVVSFSPHPRVTLGRSEGLQLLSSDEEKASLLEHAGVDILILLSFDKSFSALSHEEFISEYLIKRIGMKELIVGFNHHMGHDGGNSDTMKMSATKYGFQLTPATEYTPHQGEKVSSSTIRQLLSQGHIEAAAELLGVGYLIIGETDTTGVVMLSEPLKLLPPSGKYLATVNGQREVVSIDTNGQIWSEQRDKNVKINLISRYETK